MAVCMNWGSSFGVLVIRALGFGFVLGTLMFGNSQIAARVSMRSSDPANSRASGGTTETSRQRAGSASAAAASRGTRALGLGVSGSRLPIWVQI